MYKRNRVREFVNFSHYLHGPSYSTIPFCTSQRSFIYIHTQPSVFLSVVLPLTFHSLAAFLGKFIKRFHASFYENRGVSRGEIERESSALSIMVRARCVALCRPHCIYSIVYSNRMLCRIRRKTGSEWSNEKERTRRRKNKDRGERRKRFI